MSALPRKTDIGKWWEDYDPNELYAQAHEKVSGGWHYSLPDYRNGAYKSAETVIRMLIDIVSKKRKLTAEYSLPLSTR